MDERSGDETPDRRPSRPGAPRRPVRHHARPGGSARPLGESGSAAEQTSRGSAPAPGRTGSGRASSGPRPFASGSGGIRHRSASPDAAASPSHGEEGYGPSAADAEGSAAGLPGPRPRRVQGARGPRGSRPAEGSGRTAAQKLSRIPRPLRLGAAGLVLLLVISCAWITGLTVWANGRITHVDALSSAADTPGTTYLIAGSDRRGGTTLKDDGVQGQRADTMMILHKAANGNAYLVSLPRDTLVDIPGKGKYKLNAAYSFGGPKLLVSTVEGFTGLTIDHFVEIGFDGVSGLVDAVGTVNLCLDQDVDDKKSGLKWTKGCHDTGGEQALAFVRARYFDPTADLGRQKRQQQFVSALMKEVMTPGVVLNPFTQVKLAEAGTAALRTDDSTGVVTMGRMALAMRSVMKSGGSLAMPIEDANYRTRTQGVAIKTDPATISAFFGSIEDGSAKGSAKDG